MYTTEELKNLEWWRGFLAFLVFIAHVIQIVWYPVIGSIGVAQKVIGSVANLSVVFFFVLSGILISYSAENVCKEGFFDWKKYFINRVSRIYPSLIVVLILCGVLSALFPLLNGQSINIHRLDSDRYLVRDFFAVDWQSVLKASFMLHSDIVQINGPLWSLFIEWWLYISGLFTFLAMKKNGLNAKKYLYYFLAILVLLFAYYGYGIRVFVYIAIWYWGVMYTLYFRFNYKQYNAVIVVSFLAFIALLLVKGITVLDATLPKNIPYGLIQFIYAVLFIRICFKYSGKYFFAKMAQYSYTLYIIHFPVALFIFALLRPFALADSIKLSCETLLILLVVIGVAKYVANYTEDKYLFRSLINGFLVRHR